MVVVPNGRCNAFEKAIASPMRALRYLFFGTHCRHVSMPGSWMRIWSSIKLSRILTARNDNDEDSAHAASKRLCSLADTVAMSKLGFVKMARMRKIVQAAAVR